MSRTDTRKLETRRPEADERSEPRPSGSGSRCPLAHARGSDNSARAWGTTMNGYSSAVGSLGLAVATACGLWAGGGAGPEGKGLAAKLRALEPRVAPGEGGGEARQLRALRDAANRRESKAW